ncbi:MAG: type IX secretion system PorP/SprF family membrane protein [Saprospiraceae bacterium]|jgi:type IX secretion system PorP/SprF family membrane protein
MLLFLFGILIGEAAFSQQIPLLIQSRDNHALLNPASLSNDYLIYNRSVGLDVTIQNYGAGSDLAPKTGALTFHTLIGGNDSGVKLLLGGNLLFDDEGFTQTLSSQLRLAGIFSTNPDREKIVIGLSGGVSQFRINTEEVRLVDAGDVKGMTGLTQWYPDFSLGVFYSRWLQNDDNIYFGFSVPQLFSLDKRVSNEAGDYQLEKQAHYMAHAGFHKFIGGNSLLEPSLRLLFLKDAPTYFDAKIRWKWRKAFWLGVGAANNGFLQYEAGFYIEKKKANAANLAIGIAVQSQVLGSETTPLGNSIELKISWSKPAND